MHAKHTFAYILVLSAAFSCAPAGGVVAHEPELAPQPQGPTQQAPYVSPAAPVRPVAQATCAWLDTRDTELLAACDVVVSDWCDSECASLGVRAHENPIGDTGAECVCSWTDACTGVRWVGPEGGLYCVLEGSYADMAKPVL